MFCNGRADTPQAFTIIVLTSVGHLLMRRWSGRIFSQLTGQFADKPTRGQSSRGLDNLQTSQLANSELLKYHGMMELLYFICTLNLT